MLSRAAATTRRRRPAGGLGGHARRLVAAVGLAVALGAPAWPARAADPDPAVAPIPQFDFDDPAKSLVVRLHFDGPTDVSLVSATADFGRAQTNLGKPPILGVQLVDHGGNVVSSFREWSPLQIETLDPELGGEEVSQAAGTFSFPFRPDLRAMKVSDLRLAQELIEVDLVPAILAFCADNPTEPECAVDLGIVSFEAVDPPDEVLVGESAEITLRKTITNLGPLGIMDTQLTTTATASAGATVSPMALVLEEDELVLDEQRVVEETFTVACQGFSSHLFTFVNQIEPLNPVFLDPNPDNDQAVLELEIECVVPVAVNIKPGSDPNSVQTRRGTVPVAVLTTEAGEYGLPLAFDATAIDPASVRFGPADVLAGGGGAPERHGRGHVEDSRELDETTRDGDADMVLHFRAAESGLELDDVEACVKGKWLDAMGGVHTFLGCDAVRIVPGAGKGKPG